MTTGEKIAKLRKENNYTQEQLAEVLGVSRQAVSRWETDQMYPDTEKMIVISKVFQCTMDYLLKEEIEDKNVNTVQVKQEQVTNTSQSQEYPFSKGAFMTYMSFPPLFGWIVAFYSIRYQKEQEDTLKLILSVVGMLFSLTMTFLMIAGFVFDL